MKAAFMDGPEKFVIRDCPLPIPSEEEVIVKIHACAVCGSDLTLYKMGIADRILGHEFSGEITATGRGVKNWKIGDRVIIDPQLICGNCFWCRKKQYNLCNSLQYTGLATNGGLAEYAAVPSYQLHALPDNVSYVWGSLIEPLSVALRGVQRSGIKPGDTVAVFGCGAIGLFSILWAREFQAGKIIASDISPVRLKAVTTLVDCTLNPAECDVTEEIMRITEGRGADIVFECSGSNQAQLIAIDAVSKGGVVMLLGIGYEIVPLPLMQVTLKEIEIKGSLGYHSLTGNGEFSQAIQAISSGQINLSGLPFNTYSLDAVGSAFSDSLHGNTLKAIVIM